MKRIAIICYLILVFSVGTAHAQQYEVAPASTKAFTTAAGITPGGTISLDIYHKIWNYLLGLEIPWGFPLTQVNKS